MHIIVIISLILPFALNVQIVQVHWTLLQENLISLHVNNIDVDQHIYTV